MTSDRHHPLLPNLQILRGLAALIITICHLQAAIIHAEIPNDVPDLTVVGDRGVDVFFVLSGFMLMYTTWSERGVAASRQFVARRLLRVVPLYWCVTTIVFVQMIFKYPNAVLPLSDLKFQARHVLASYFFFPYPEMERGSDVYPILGSSWTLIYEVEFYAIFAICLLLRNTYRLTFVSLATAVMILIFLVCDPPLPFSYWLDPILFEFVLGVALAFLFHLGVRLPSSLSLAIGLSAVVCLVIEQRLGVAVDDMRPLWGGLPSALLMASALFLPYVRNRLSSVCIALGNISYSLCLIHPLIYDAVLSRLRSRLIHDPSMIAWLAPILIVVTIAMAFACFRLVERPLNRKLGSLVLRGRSREPWSPRTARPAADPGQG